MEQYSWNCPNITALSKKIFLQWFYSNFCLLCQVRRTSRLPQSLMTNSSWTAMSSRSFHTFKTKPCAQTWQSCMKMPMVWLSMTQTRRAASKNAVKMSEFRWLLCYLRESPSCSSLPSTPEVSLGNMFLGLVFLPIIVPSFWFKGIFVQLSFIFFYFFSPRN